MQIRRVAMNRDVISIPNWNGCSSCYYSTRLPLGMRSSWSYERVGDTAVVFYIWSLLSSETRIEHWKLGYRKIKHGWWYLDNWMCLLIILKFLNQPIKLFAIWTNSWYSSVGRILFHRASYLGFPSAMWRRLYSSLVDPAGYWIVCLTMCHRSPIDSMTAKDSLDFRIITEELCK